jgi:protein-disulfide isomerase
VRVLVLLLIVVLAALPQRAGALPPVAAMLAERSLGNEQAKVTIIEYSSLTCPHCAEFHSETLPKLKTDYIDKGLVRYVLRDFPLDGRAMAAAMLAHCVPPQRYFGFVEILFRDQQTWARGADPLADLKTRAQLAGLSQADADACLANRELLTGIQTRASEAQKRDGLESTPTFLIDGRKLSGALPYADFQKAIDEALAKAK